MPDTTPAELLRSAMDAQGILDNATRAGIAAISMGESHMLGHVETGYAHTSNDRIRLVFGGRVPADDAALNALKANDQDFFEWVYGYQTHVGKGLGNRKPGDGFKYRGRFGVQTTGLANYTLDATAIGHPEIIDNPDAALSDPAIGMAMTVAYIKRCYHGGGFAVMMACVGNNTADIAATKRTYFAQYSASREFNVGRTEPVPAVPAAAAPPAAGQLGAHVLYQGSPYHDEVIALQGKLGVAADGDYGPATMAAVAAFQRSHGLTVDGIAGRITIGAILA